mmetsp:Transcript_10840/g.24248  ORF Transcript_10840/g.24248 Transcript_10840/m.24248 type:complete len:645 (+) Transcript_10840:70-2004(+)
MGKNRKGRKQQPSVVSANNGKKIRDKPSRASMRSSTSTATTTNAAAAIISHYCEYVPLVLATFFAYSPTFKAKEGVWDDEIVFESAQVTNPSTMAGLRDIWFDPLAGREIHYWPMTYTSFWLEFVIHGLHPGLCHLTNVALHFANACIVRRILDNIGLGRQVSWLAASIFALHPINVESTAWIIERKDTLSGIFYLSALVTHPNMSAVARSDGSASNGAFIWLSLLLYVLGMLSKTSIVTLPAVLLLIPWALRGRITLSEAKRAAPFFFVGLLMAAYDVSLAKKQEPIHFNLTLMERILIASRCVVFYLTKLAYPGVLMVIYPRWDVNEDTIVWASCYALVIALLFGLFFLRERLGRAPLAALLFFGGTLFPVLGLIDYGFMTYAFVAERFQYLAGLGPITIVSASVGRYVTKHCGSTRRVSANAAMFALLAYLASRTYKQSSIYQNQEVFWTHIIDANPIAKSAHLNLANEFLRQELWAKTEPLYATALEQNPNEPKALVNIAIALEKLGKYEEASKHLEQCLRLQPSNVKALNGLGNVMSSLGRHEDAATYFKRVIALNPKNTVAWNNMGNENARLGRFEDAVDAYKGALHINPRYTKCRLGLAYVLGVLGRKDEAIEEYHNILSYEPSNVAAKERLAKLQS